MNEYINNQNNNLQILDEVRILFPQLFPKTRSGWEKLGFTVYGCRFVTKHHPAYVLGKGSFGTVWKSYDSLFNSFCALKIQSATSHVEVRLGIANTEAMLLSNISGRGIPKIYGSGKNEMAGQHYYYTGMTLLGPNLGLMLKGFGGKFKIPTVCLIALQMIDRLEEIHECGVIHRDIKPDNFAFGSKIDPHTLYLIDFGFAKCYTDPNTGEHIKKDKTDYFLGTPSFASINVHSGCVSSRRDDLESMMYVIIFLLNGRLPWSGIKHYQKDKSKGNIRDLIYSYKKKMCIGELFERQSEEWISMMIHIRKLDFKERPDYHYLRFQVYNILNRYTKEDQIYEWLKPSNANSKSSIYSLASVYSNSDSGGGVATISELEKTLDFLDPIDSKGEPNKMVNGQEEDEMIHNHQTQTTNMSTTNFSSFKIKDSSLFNSTTHQSFKQHSSHSLSKLIDQTSISSILKNKLSRTDSSPRIPLVSKIKKSRP